MNDFDHGKYQAALAVLTKTAYDEYKHVSMDLPSYQAGLLRTYLWLSSLVATLEVGFFYKAVSGGIQWGGAVCVPAGWFFVFAAAALMGAFSAFVLGVDSLRGRGKACFPLGDFTSLATMAHEMASEPGSTKLYPSMITALDAEINRQTAVVNRKGIKLRSMSLLTLLSVGFAALAGLDLFLGW
ncbi:MAG: hypothetical protein AB7E32_17190 [Desulfovibrio sp.]